MSDAVAGVGTLFQKWDSSESAYITIAEIGSITGPGMSRDTIDVTSLDSTGGYREFIAGFRNPGTIGLAMNFTRDMFDVFKDDFESDLLQAYQIVLPDTRQTTITFDGLVTELPLAIPADDKISMDVTIQISGQVTVGDYEEVDTWESDAVYARTFYIAPTGNDTTGTGSKTAPWATLPKAVESAIAGDVIYVRGGTYTISTIPGDQYMRIAYLDGAAGNLIKIWNFPGESPIFDASTCAPANYKSIMSMVSCSYIHVRGLRITGLQQYNSGLGYGGNYGFVGENVHHCIFERMETDHMGGAGFQIWNTLSSDNLILNCDSHNNADPYSSDAWSNANGFNITPSGGTNNIFRGCRAWFNSDDGFDLYGYAGTAYFEDCWAFWNGYIPEDGVPVNFTAVGDGHGFKLGGSGEGEPTTVKTFVENCLSVHNFTIGFSQNGAEHAHRIQNCGAYNNASHPYHTGVAYLGTPYSNVYQNNWAYGGVLAINSATTNDHNTWNLGITINPSTDFVNVDETELISARDADGNLPSINAFHLRAASQLRDVGVDIGLPYNAPVPDLGPFEY